MIDTSHQTPTSTIANCDANMNYIRLLADFNWIVGLEIVLCIFAALFARLIYRLLWD